MNRKRMAFLLALCMLISLLPALPVAQAAGSNDIWVHYDTDFGSVFWSKGSYQPTQSADDFICDNEHVTVNSSTQIHFLIDPDHAIDRWRWENEQELVFMEPAEAEDRNLYVRVSYDTDDGWYEALVVDHGVAVQPGYSFVDNVLSFKASDARGSVDVNVFWTDSDYAYESFNPGENEILIDYCWNGAEQPTLAQESAVLRDFAQPERGRRRIVVPDSTQSLRFTWNGYLQHLWGSNVNHDNQWGDLNDVSGNEYVLYLDGHDGDEAWNHYDLGFDFAGDWNYLFGVNYDMNGGLVFQTVGGSTPTATAAAFLPRQGDGRDGWPDKASFQGQDGPQTIRLLLDETRALDWDAWDREQPELRFVEPWHSDDRAVSVVARYNGSDGWHEELLVEEGVAAPGVSFENHVLSFTPESGFGVEFEIYWTRDDYAFSRFERTEEKPVLVEASWWGAGSVRLADQVDEADTMIRDGRMRVRVAADVQALSFTWDAGDELRQINVEGLGENGDWLNGIHPEGNSYTLQLNQRWDNGDPKDWYNVQFEFEGGGGAQAAAFYDQSKGSIFWALGDDTPAADAAHYLDFGFEHSFNFNPDGQLQPIRLRFDGSIGLDFDYYNEHDGAIRFVDSWVPTEQRIVGVYADCDWCSGPIFWDGEVTEEGAAQGVSYENGVLTLQPANSSDLMLHVYWTQADADFDAFQGTEECPVIVEYRWWNHGEIPVPEGVPEEDYCLFADGGAARIRLPLDRERVTFTWAEEYGVHRIGYSVRSEDGEDWMDFEVDQSQPHSFTLELNQVEQMDGRVEPCTWYQVEFEFYEDSRYQVWINWKQSEGNVYFGLNEAPPAVVDPEAYDLERYYVDYGRWMPSSLLADENGNTEIGTVYLRLDPAHSVNYFGEGPAMWTLPEYDYCPTIYMEYPLEGALGEWFEGPVVLDGQVVSDFVRFEDNVLSFTPINEQPVIVHIFWSREDRAFWDFDLTQECPVMVELMLGDRVPVKLPADIPEEDIQIWHAAEHDYIKVRLPEDRESLELSWNSEGSVSLIEVDGAGENGEALRIDFPVGRSYQMPLTQMQDGRPREYYSATFWGFGWLENPFRDVPESAWYYEAVRFAVSMGITTGTSEDSFTPDRALSRAEFVTFLWRAAGSPEPSSAACPFDDVPETAWYRKAVCWAAETGITGGTAERTFSPKGRCTRAQVVTLLWRANGGSEPTGGAAAFTDVPGDAWYRDAVYWAAAQGITAGISETEFGPTCSCTRAMAVLFLFRHTVNQWRGE